MMALNPVSQNSFNLHPIPSQEPLGQTEGPFSSSFFMMAGTMLLPLFLPQRLGTALFVGMTAFQSASAFAAKPKGGEFELKEDESKVDYKAWIISAVALIGGVLLTRKLAPIFRGNGEHQHFLAKVAFGAEPATFIQQIERNLAAGKRLSGLDRMMCHASEYALPIVGLEAGLRLLLGYDLALSPLGGGRRGSFLESGGCSVLEA